MTYRIRFLEAVIRENVRRYEVIVVTGPRQAGKTSMVEHVGRALFPGMETVAFDTPADVDAFRRDPGLFFANHPGVLFLDEVQQAPDVLPYVKKEVDRLRGTFRFFLSGSQPLDVMRGVSESLAGRALILDLWPFCGQEMRGVPEAGSAADTLARLTRPESLEELLGASFPANDRQGVLPAMLAGGYPKMCIHQAGGAWLDSYRRTYIQRDVRDLRQVGDLGRFDRLLALCAGLSGTTINKAELGRALGVDNKTVDGWLSLMKDSYQLVEIPPFFTNPGKRLVKRPKYVLADIGLAIHVQGIRDHAGLANAPHFGNLFESFVIMEIRKLHGHAAMPWDGHFWRTPRGAECDLVLPSGSRAVPVEIKHSSRIRGEDLRGIRGFREMYGKHAGPGAVISMHPRVERVAADIWNVPLGLLLHGAVSR